MRRTIALALATTIVALIAAITGLNIAHRYRNGASQLHRIIPHGPDSILVMLYDITFVAPAEQEEAFRACVAYGGPVPYRVDTWRHRQDGLLEGNIGSSHSAGSHITESTIRI